MIKAYAAQKPKGTLERFEYEPKSAGPQDIEIKITHCGICHSDLHLVDDDWNVGHYPLVPGHEIVGRVTKVGNEVTSVAIGTRVGVGWQCGSCMACEACIRGEENLCRQQNSTCMRNHGGFADRIIVDHRFAFPIPDALSSEVAAPLLCGGITVFSPIQRWATPQSRVGVIGVGGLGHLAIQFANAFGCDVTAFSSNPAKEDEVRALGAHHFVSSTDSDALKACRDSLDLIVSTVHVDLPWQRYLAALAPHGTLCFVGALANPIQIATGALLAGQKKITGSVIGGRRAMNDMLEFAARHNIGAKIEVLPMQEVNVALKRLRDNDVRYRFVLKV